MRLDLLGILSLWFSRFFWKATLFGGVKGMLSRIIAIVHRGLSDMLADRFVQRQYQRIRTIIFDCAYTYSINDYFVALDKLRIVGFVVYVLQCFRNNMRFCGILHIR